MPHVSQKIRMQNLALVKKLVAKAMPKGAKDQELQAVLCVNYGFHRRTVKEYLSDLQDSGQIVWDTESKRWKLPFDEKTDKK